jgi:glycosyltransferase involved in cell wall biosynthesis
MLPLGYAVRAAHARRVPLVISPRGMLAPWSLRRSRWKKLLAGRLIHPDAFQSAAAWHATSQREAEDIQSLGFQQPVCVAPNGIEPPAMDPTLARAHYLRVAPELAGKRVLLFYSRFHSKKRIKELLADFAPISGRQPEWHLLCVGIPEEYSVDDLRAAAAGLGLASRTTFLDGRDAPKPYAVAHLFALPTHDENFGRVIAEALAWGVPVITTTGTPWEQLNTIGAGRWVEIAAFAQELEGLMARPLDELRVAGERGRTWVVEEFDWARIAKTLRGFYERLTTHVPLVPA